MGKRRNCRAGIVPLEADEALGFPIVNERFRRLPLPNVVGPEQDGRMIYDREIWEVQHQTTERKGGRIIYGLVRPGPGSPAFIRLR